ncbi:hypothetical protein K435DRAFT_964408 [Dendrothele bispora CBS 962.96]|uniref:Ricin B lectin domain-containing protein n=1 Tax=Dendrothele bispora (strain CBS 962.96) TaxID=1314807 RepID=A0A4S8MAL5_DENBC|nr:hypothetical protein K435DRAFT_964408 [Dendrothele bispora CBS 962.96]
MVNLLNLTASAAAASVMILDHTKSLGLDLVNGGCQNYTTVQQFPVISTNANQKWNLNIVGANEFQIVSVPCGTTLSYAGSETGANSVRSQPVAIRGSQTIWTVVSVNNTDPNAGFRSGMALTAWANVSIGGTAAPLTLEPRVNADARQTFFFA